MAESKAAVVTGTSAGIGAEVARMLLAKGWRVLGVARRDAPIKDKGYTHLRFDLADVVTQPKPLTDAIAAIAKGASRIGLVNNAALIGHLGTIRELEADELRQVLTVNTVAPLWLMNTVLDLAAATTRIVNVSTGAATGAYPGIGAYSTSKAALRMVSMQFASEWDAPETKTTSPKDAAILSYEPGIVDTPMQTTAREQTTKAFPWDMFRGFKRSNALVSADQPAAEIVEFLESSREPSFAERRLGS